LAWGFWSFHIGENFIVPHQFRLEGTKLPSRGRAAFLSRPHGQDASFRKDCSFWGEGRTKLGLDSQSSTPGQSLLVCLSNLPVIAEWAVHLLPALSPFLPLPRHQGGLPSGHLVLSSWERLGTFRRKLSMNRQFVMTR